MKDKNSELHRSRQESELKKKNLYPSLNSTYFY